jgi:hypothetical protein
MFSRHQRWAICNDDTSQTRSHTCASLSHCVRSLTWQTHPMSAHSWNPANNPPQWSTSKTCPSPTRKQHDKICSFIKQTRTNRESTTPTHTCYMYNEDDVDDVGGWIQLRHITGRKTNCMYGGYIRSVLVVTGIWVGRTITDRYKHTHTRTRSVNCWDKCVAQQRNDNSSITNTVQQCLS